MNPEQQSPEPSPVRRRHGGAGLLAGILLGFCCASAAFLAAGFTIWNAKTPREPVPEEKAASAGITVVSPSPRRKKYTARIEPDLSVSSVETRALEIPSLE